MELVARPVVVPVRGNHLGLMAPSLVLLLVQQLTWRLSHRADPRARELADRHYNRQKVGAPQFVPPGRCIVLWQPHAFWITGWPFAEYVKHAWAGAWVNSAFRREPAAADLASEMIREAIAVTRSIWEPPQIGMVTFVNPSKVKPKRDPGYCYLQAGFRLVGMTQGGLLTFQMLPNEMPEPQQLETLEPA